MRDICFRGQQNDTREWRYGSFAQVDGDAFIISPFSKMNDEYGVTVPDCVQVLRETAGEFTGLVDQNGKQIFEGDIVKGGNQYNESHCGTVSFGRIGTGQATIATILDSSSSGPTASIGGKSWPTG